MEAYPGQTRMYVIIGALLGIVVGVFMENFFMSQAGGVRLAWLAIFAAFGGSVGKLLVVAQAPERPKHTAETPDIPDDPEVSATRFFKLQSGVFSDEEFRRLRVRSVIMPMSPPDSELELQVRDFDHYARVPVLERVLERMTAAEVADRVMSEAKSRAPKVPGDLALSLVSFHSEGPLAPDGRSPLGWSFYLVDGVAGLGCLATTTDREIALHFHTAATYSQPEPWEWIELEDVLKWAETALPEWVDQDVRVRVNLPDDYLCFVSDPLRVADVDIVEERVVNDAYLSESVTGEARERFALQDLLAWFRGGTLGPDASDFARAIEDNAFADGLRTLQPEAIGRVATALERFAGPGVVSQLVDTLVDCDEHEEQLELLNILSRVPTGLAEVALHRLSVESEAPDVARIAGELHEAWRHGKIDVPRHPLDSLSFLDVRQRMGRSTLTVVPLISTFNPEEEILPVLCELGFHESRRRMLSGSANLLVGARLRGTRSRTELLLTSTPLPVACHVLHIVGEQAERVAERVRRLPIAYAEHQIIADIQEGSPSELHAAALYVTALRIDEATIITPMREGYERARRNPAMRRALLSALAVQSDSETRDWVDTIAENEEHEDAAAAKQALSSPRMTGSAVSV